MSDKDTKDPMSGFDWDEYHEAVSLYRELCKGGISILYLNNHKYVKVQEETDEPTSRVE